MKVALKHLRNETDGEECLPDNMPKASVVDDHCVKSCRVVAVNMKYSNLCSHLQRQLIED